MPGDLSNYLTSGKRAHNYIAYQDVNILGCDVKMDALIYRTVWLKEGKKEKARKIYSGSSVQIPSAIAHRFILISEIILIC